MNIREPDDAVLIEAELPGIDSGGVDVAVTGDELVLKGCRPRPAEAPPTTARSQPEDGDGDRPSGVTSRSEPAERAGRTCGRVSVRGGVVPHEPGREQETDRWA